MRFARLICGVFFLVFLATGTALAQQRLKSSEAKDHVGETATVCGLVASTHYAASSRRQPTFLNLDAAYPSQIFTIVIWGSDRTKFGRPEAEYNNKRVCITGKISEYKGVAEVIATEPSQIKVGNRD
jgi:hypothetical protein